MPQRQPLISPQEMVARLVASYLLTYRAAGRNVDVRDVEREVIADCELVDAARRAGELDGGKRDERPSQVRPDVLGQAQTETGTELRRAEIALDAADADSPHRYKPQALHRNPMQVSARWGAACARISRILEGAAGSTLTGAVQNAQIPALARKYAEAWGYYLTRAAPPPAHRVDHNPFRGMSDRDASRAFMRAVEDVCDQSTGVLGSWYVK